MNEQLAFWINVLASSAAIFGLFFVAFELYRSRQAEVRQFHFDTFKIFSIDMKQDRLLVSRLGPVAPEALVATIAGDYETGQAFKNLLDFYTLLASAAHDKTINREKTFEYWGQSIISFWSRYGPLLMQRRELMGPEAFRELEWFNDESMKAHPTFAGIVETMHKVDKNTWAGEQESDPESSS